MPEPEAFVADGEVLAMGRPVYGGQNASYEHETRMQLVKCQAVRGRLGVSLLGIPLQLLLHLVPGSSLELPAPQQSTAEHWVVDPLGKDTAKYSYC